MINLPSFYPFFVLKLEVRALSQNVCNGIYGLVALKIFSGEGAPRHPYDFRAFSAQSRTNYFKLATPLHIIIDTSTSTRKFAVLKVRAKRPNAKTTKLEQKGQCQKQSNCVKSGLNGHSQNSKVNVENKLYVLCSSAFSLGKTGSFGSHALNT